MAVFREGFAHYRLCCQTCLINSFVQALRPFLDVQDRKNPCGQTYTLGHFIWSNSMDEIVEWAFFTGPNFWFPTYRASRSRVWHFCFLSEGLSPNRDPMTFCFWVFVVLLTNKQCYVSLLQISARPLHFAPSSMHYLLIILPFNAIDNTMRKPQINK
jgi:hypothetical protein